MPSFEVSKSVIVPNTPDHRSAAQAFLDAFDMEAPRHGITFRVTEYEMHGQRKVSLGYKFVTVYPEGETSVHPTLPRELHPPE